LAPPCGEPRLSISLDGLANDGQPGENTLVDADVENVTLLNPYDGGPVPGGNTVVGNDDPNRLIGAGTVRGLGGDDVIVSNAATANKLDGGAGDDRISARVYDEASQYLVADEIACGKGDDVLFRDSRDPRPADCEHFDLGLHVAAATAPVGPRGRAAVRIRCADLVPCLLGRVTIRYRGHRASVRERRQVTIAPGHTVTYRVLLYRWARRPGRFRTLPVTAVLDGTAGGLYAGFPRAITLIRAR
jgi:hypothetical protein